MSSAKQAPFIGRVESVLSSARLERYAAGTTEPRWESLARYARNVAICEAFYPLLHYLEIVLRNRLYELGKVSFRYQRIQHIDCWLDADPSPLHPFGAADVLRAKQKLFGVDYRTGGLHTTARSFEPGDLVAALDFGFWTGLFSNHYLFQSSRVRRLWPHGLSQVFPHAARPLKLHEIKGRLNTARQLRNRVFHHEPIWRRPDLAGDRDNLIELVTWMSPEVARVLCATERLPEVLSPHFQRRLRIRIYRETRR